MPVCWDNVMTSFKLQLLLFSSPSVNAMTTREPDFRFVRCNAQYSAS